MGDRGCQSGVSQMLRRIYSFVAPLKATMNGRQIESLRALHWVSTGICLRRLLVDDGPRWGVTRVRPASGNTGRLTPLFRLLLLDLSIMKAIISLPEEAFIHLWFPWDAAIATLSASICLKKSSLGYMLRENHVARIHWWHRRGWSYSTRVYDATTCPFRLCLTVKVVTSVIFRFVLSERKRLLLVQVVLISSSFWFLAFPQLLSTCPTNCDYIIIEILCVLFFGLRNS